MRIRKATTAIHSRNIRKAKQAAIVAAYNPANVYLCTYVIDQVIL